MNKKLEMYLASVNAAASSLGKKPDEITAIKKDAFTKLGLTARVDYDLFENLFNDAAGVAAQHAAQKLPSEHAAAPAFA